MVKIFETTLLVAADPLAGSTAKKYSVNLLGGLGLTGKLNDRAWFALNQGLLQLSHRKPIGPVEIYQNGNWNIESMKVHATTILTVEHGGKVAMGGDGQVTLGTAIMKSDAMKIRRLLDGKVLCGFAGSTADAFALLERFEEKLKDSPNNIPRAATDLAKQWRTDKALRQLEALLTVTDGRHTLLLSGTGDVIQPTDGIVGIGSGGNYAIAVARALKSHSSLSAVEIVKESLRIAGEIDIYTNTNIVVEELACPE